MSKARPWGLPPSVAATVQAVIETGCNKGACRQRNLAPSTIYKQMAHALHKSGKANRVQMLIEFDRLTREAA